MASEFEKNSTNMYVEQSPQGLENGQVQKNVDDDGREKRTGTVLTASAHIITAVIGSGVLSLAWAMAQLGWVAGIVILFLFSFITYFTSTLLADCYRSPGPVAGKRNYSYMEVVRSHLGGIKVQLCGISQYGNLVGITIGYTITASISMVAVVRSNCFHKKGHQANCTVSNYPYMAVFAVLQIILSQIPNFHKLSWLSILAAVMSFAYSLIGLGLSIAKDTLRSPPAENKAMKRASLVGVFTTTLFYVLCGTIGYAAFGNNAPGNFLTGFGFYEPFWLIDIANVCIAIHLIGAYQVFCQPIYGFVEGRCNEKWPNSKFITTQHAINIPWFGVYNANYFRMLWRTAYVIVTAVIAMIFPFFNAILGLIGAASFYPLTVYFPIEMHIAQKKIPKFSFTWIWLQILSWACLIVSLVAATGSIEGLIQDVKEYKPFKPQEHE
ncbi:Amino acid permease 1 [Capsicum annuum]|uniref:Amino acid permease 1 n=1 Tax=Capsicum annuum TaxID=4072 RepID=A0A2G2Y9H3_CAPAN|nr:Amino acid permease 1 [Capsicum annuum]